uniref:Uncharacterized protein n=1 Tax=Arundo donax TaxID=35708 RepID=A0A0A9EDQ2_ARUDO
MASSLGYSGRWSGSLGLLLRAVVFFYLNPYYDRCERATLGNSVVGHLQHRYMLLLLYALCYLWWSACALYYL